MIGCRLHGGLGNNIYQLAFLDYLTNLFKKEGYIEKEESRPIDYYFSTIFKNFTFPANIIPSNKIYEENLHPIDLTTLPNEVFFHGYFQNYKYIRQEFIENLYFDKAILEKYPTIQDSVFLHIRGGDYLHISLFQVGLEKYYERAIQLFNKDIHFYIFTNDKEYAKTFSFLNSIQHTFIDENEQDSLFLMSQCKGGICANSSFSWWGAYLNRHRQLILPSKWYTDPQLYKEGYYFPECTIVDV